VTDTKTKVVCTIGPASSDPSVLRAMIAEGMDVARVNFSHGTREEHAARIEMIRKTADACRATVAIMADLQGPKFRIGALREPLKLHVGNWLALTSEAADGTAHVIPLPHAEILQGVQVSQRLLLDDGAVELCIREKRPGVLICEVVVGGILSSHKGIAAPEASIAMSSLTPKDREDARFALDRGVDFLALSFVRTAKDVRDLRTLIHEQSGEDAPVHIIAKVESQQAISNLSEILPLVDAVMVARGDLGVELSPQEVPLHQKEIIRRCNQAGIPVITATQMLQSMIENPRPTRAEASDVANAILDGTDAVMLSAETAVGSFPIHAVRIIRRISEVIEGHMPHTQLADKPDALPFVHPVTDAIGDATADIAEALAVKLIVTTTASGYTARQVARKRPRQAIVAFTPSASVQRQLALVWGVTPHLAPLCTTTDGMLDSVQRVLLEHGECQSGDRVVLTGGIPVGGGGRTNFVKVHTI